MATRLPIVLRTIKGGRFSFPEGECLFGSLNRQQHLDSCWRRRPPSRANSSATWQIAPSAVHRFHGLLTTQGDRRPQLLLGCYPCAVSPVLLWHGADVSIHGMLDFFLGIVKDKLREVITRNLLSEKEETRSPIPSFFFVLAHCRLLGKCSMFSPTNSLGST